MKLTLLVTRRTFGVNMMLACALNVYPDMRRTPATAKSGDWTYCLIRLSKLQARHSIINPNSPVFLPSKYNGKL